MPDEGAIELTAHSPQRATLDLPEVAALLGISRSTAFRLARTGELPAIRIGRRWLVSRSVIDGWLREGTTDGDGAAEQTPELADDDRASELQQRIIKLATENGIQLDLSRSDPFGDKLASSLSELSDDQVEVLWKSACGLIKELRPPLNFTAMLLSLPLAAERAVRPREG